MMDTEHSSLAVLLLSRSAALAQEPIDKTQASSNLLP